MSKSKREISGRSRVNQALFGLNKFVNREIFGKKDTKYMKEYNPTVGVTYGSLPSNYKSTEAEQFRKADMYNRTTKGRTDLGTGVDGLMFDPTLKEKEQTYGPKRRAGDLLERFVGQQIDQNQLLGYNQALTNQEIAAMSETNRQRLETNLAFDRDSPTRQQERQYKAKAGEALLAEAVAKQATSAAQIGGLGTARTYGSGRVN
tara:strand:+ start:564 stop:1175 length:612 start_codon:yes stop_codon:yes gene_type:complete